jgi:hypothetical protein
MSVSSVPAIRPTSQATPVGNAAVAQGNDDVKGHGTQTVIGSAQIIWRLLTQSGKAEDIKSLTKAKSQDEALGTLVSSVAVLGLGGTGVRDLDKQLHDNFKGTIDKYVTDPTANKVLTGVGNIFGDRLASVLIAAALGNLTTVIQDVRRDPALSAQMTSDPAAFGMAVLARSGQSLPKDLASAFITSKIQDIPVIGWFAFMIAPFLVKKLMGNS